MILNNLNLFAEQLLERLERIEQQLSLLTRQQNNTATDSDLMNVEQAAKFLRRSTTSIYILVSTKKIPYMKQGGRLYFSKNELLEWVRNSKRANGLGSTLSDSDITQIINKATGEYDSER